MDKVSVINYVSQDKYFIYAPGRAPFEGEYFTAEKLAKANGQKKLQVTFIDGSGDAPITNYFNI